MILMKEGWDLDRGDKIGYVIVVGPGSLYEKARPYILASYDEIDLDYYIKNQVLPAAARILGMFDVTEGELLPTKLHQSLIDFTKG
jgi:DNA polymerase I